MIKQCTKCKKEYPLNEHFFNINKDYKDGFSYYCKKCQQEINRKYYKEHRERLNEQNKQYQQDHKEEITEQRRNHYQETINLQRERAKKYYYQHREERNKYSRNYQQTNKDRLRIYYLDRHYQRLNNNVHYRLLHNLRANITSAFDKRYKSGKAIDLVGCSIDFLKKHLESQFKENMTWENYGKGGWHIDHRKPCCTFDLTDPIEQRKCFHWSNLQPLWEEENLKKGKKHWDRRPNVR